MNTYALIMAGGEGKRFWPLSTKDKPKQFLSLFGGKSLIRQTVDRVLPIIAIEKVFIVTLQAYAEETLKHIPELPKENLILEPRGRNTAMCIAYGSLRISAIDPDSTTVVMPADHAIGEEGNFRNAIRFGCKVSNERLTNSDYPLITLGIKPKSPETGYGYIKAGEEEILSDAGLTAFKALKFTEKPELEKAKEFLTEGCYYWNSGMFVWKTSSILREFSKVLPAWNDGLGNLSTSVGTAKEEKAAAEFYAHVEGGSVDKLILERSDKTVVIPVSFPWSDVGSWKALYDFLCETNNENITPENTLTINTSGSMVVGSAKTVALVGVSDLIVVDTEDSILVLNKSDSQDVKKIVEILEKKEKEE